MSGGRWLRATGMFESLGHQASARPHLIQPGRILPATTTLEQPPGTRINRRASCCRYDIMALPGEHVKALDELRSRLSRVIVALESAHQHLATNDPLPTW